MNPAGVVLVVAGPLAEAKARLDGVTVVAADATDGPAVRHLLVEGRPSLVVLVAGTPLDQIRYDPFTMD